MGDIGKLTDSSGHCLSCPSERLVDLDEISLEKRSCLVQRIVKESNIVVGGGCCCCCCCCQVVSGVSDSVRPHRWQPTRLHHPRDSPGKNTGVGCHFFLQCMEVKSESEVAQLCLTLRDPMDCSLPGSSIHGIFQARVLEWGAIAFSGRNKATELKSCRKLKEKEKYLSR